MIDTGTDTQEQKHATINREFLDTYTEIVTHICCEELWLVRTNQPHSGMLIILDSLSYAAGSDLLSLKCQIILETNLLFLPTVHLQFIIHGCTEYFIHHYDII